MKHPYQNSAKLAYCFRSYRYAKTDREGQTHTKPTRIGNFYAQRSGNECASKELYHRNKVHFIVPYMYTVQYIIGEY